MAATREIAEQGYYRPHHWTVEEFERAIGLGLFGEEERLELVHGDVIDNMSPKNMPHNNALTLARQELERAFGFGHHVRTEHPVILAGETRREPDLLVLPGRVRDYPTTPRAEQALLVAEVSDTTLREDKKVLLYAEAGISECWIININQRRLQVYRDPEDRRYVTTFPVAEDGCISPLTAPQATIAVADLLP